MNAEGAEKAEKAEKAESPGIKEDMRQEETRRTVSPRVWTVLGVCLAVLAGVGAWLLLGGEDEAEACNGLPGDARVQAALGSAVRPDMGCAAFGEAVVRATAGREPGVHTEAQARAMKEVLVALHAQDSVGAKGLGLDPALRVSLARALADYAPDLHAMLGGTSTAHVTKAAPDVPPWESDGTYHLSVLTGTLHQVLLGTAQDPHAYALVRGAETGSAAGRLAGVPAGATGPALEGPATENAQTLGLLDGVAASVLAGRDEAGARAWRTTAVTDLVRQGSTPAEGTPTPAGRLAEAWFRGLGSVREEERYDRLGTQSVDLTRSWLETRTTENEETRRALLTKVEDRARGAARQVDAAQGA